MKSFLCLNSSVSFLYLFFFPLSFCFPLSSVPLPVLLLSQVPLSSSLHSSCLSSLALFSLILSPLLRPVIHLSSCLPCDLMLLHVCYFFPSCSLSLLFKVLSLYFLSYLLFFNFRCYLFLSLHLLFVVFSLLPVLNSSSSLSLHSLLIISFSLICSSPCITSSASPYNSHAYRI